MAKKKYKKEKGKVRRKRHHSESESDGNVSKKQCLDKNQSKGLQSHDSAIEPTQSKDTLQDDKGASKVSSGSSSGTKCVTIPEADFKSLMEFVRYVKICKIYLYHHDV